MVPGLLPIFLHGCEIKSGSGLGTRLARVQSRSCFDTKRSACPQAAAFLSRRTHITPPTYVYTPFVSDLVLPKSVAVGKTPRQALLFDCLLYWPHIAWTRCHHYQTGSTLRTNRVHHFRAFSRFFSTAAR